MYRLGGFYTLVFLSSTAFSNDERSITVDPSALTPLRAHSITHANSGAKKMQMMWVNGLSSGCDSVYLYADEDQALYSTVLAAFTSGSRVKIYYGVDEDTRGPWGDDKSCRLTSVTMVR